MFKKGNNIFSLLVIILSIFMTSTSNIVNADSTSLGTSTPQTTATTSKDSGTTGTENTNGTIDAEGITNAAPTSTEGTTDTKSTDSSTSKIDDSTKQSSTTDWGNQLITEVQLQDSTGQPLTEFHQNDNMRAYWEFSTAKNGKNNVINKGDTMEVSVPKEIALSNNDSANVYQKGTSTILGTAALSKDSRTITVTFNDTAASLSKNSEVTGSFWVNVNWDVNNTTVGKDINLDWTNQGSAQNNPGSTGTANIKPSVPDATEELYKYGGFIDKTIQWTVRINYAGDTIDNAVYKDFIGPNQTLLEDADHPVKIYSATANHDTGEITADSNNLMAGKQITKTSDGFTVDLGTITHTVMIVYYTSVDNYDNLSNYYGNTGDLYSNKTEIQNVPVNISTNKLGSDAGAGSAITSITGHKIWSVPDGTKIPSQVTINLLDNNDTVVRHQNVSKDNDWFYEFNNLPKYDSNGTEIKYTVSEDTVKGFTGLPTGNHDITNILTPDTSKIKITKIWHDGNDKYNMRPESIAVGIFAGSNNEQKELADKQSNTAVLKANDGADNWSHTWTGFTNPDDIWYVSELEPSQSSTDTPYIIGDTQNVFGNEYNKTITNTLATNFTVKKVWDDNNNAKKARPDSIKVQLYANDKVSGDPVTLSADKDWTYKFSRLPKFDDNDNEIKYTAKETNVPEGYSTSKPSIENNNTIDQTETITNTYKSTTPETTQVNVNKVWKDNKSTHNPITVHLLADDKDTGKTVKLSDDNNWSGSFTNLDKQANGKDITYKVKEDTPTGYTSKISNPDGTNNFTITNTPTQTTPTTRSFTVKKVWADGKANHNAVEVYLTKNGTKTGEPIPLNEKNGWSYTWNDLAINDGDKAIEYSAIEDPVPDGYVANTDTTNDGVQITNTAKPTTDEKTSLTVTKSWNDEDNKDKLQPSSVTVKLLANDKDTGKSITLDKGNNWTDTFKNLDKKVNDKDVIYTVQENKVADYDASYDYSKTSNLVKITNKHTPKSVTPSDNKRTFTVVKKWLITTILVILVQVKSKFN
ncbi:Cna B-type domain-containing protein [Companilactobacillus kimchii]|uniref:Cna B-type domain-containing protein n=1 Tax=Companilactobacillus kimchii TaxID=2801452 RepID=UPI0006D1C2DC|nr:Cna B-type domain-containing protein [Companilactobacillus kimchii]